MEKLSLVKNGYEGTLLSRSLVDTIERLPDGKYNIYIVKKEYLASVPQSRLFWMWMTYLEYWSGESRVKWHDHYCRMFLAPGQRSTRSLSSTAMSHFLNQIQADAQTEWNVYLPSPEDQEIYNDFILEYQNR